MRHALPGTQFWSTVQKPLSIVGKAFINLWPVYSALCYNVCGPPPHHKLAEVYEQRLFTTRRSTCPHTTITPPPENRRRASARAILLTRTRTKANKRICDDDYHQCIQKPNVCDTVRRGRAGCGANGVGLCLALVRRHVVKTPVLGTMFQFVRRTPSKSRDCALIRARNAWRWQVFSPVHVVNTPVLGTM